MFPLLLSGALAVWLAGDFGYSRYVARRVAERENATQRDQEGIETGCRGYTIGDGDTALLLIHGINSSPASYHKLAPALSDAGFTCRVMRLPGFAEPIDRYGAATRDDWLAAAKGEVEALRKDHAHVAVIGHSLGGAVSLALALDSPQSVDALVLLAPAVEVSNERSPLLPTRAWHEIAKYSLWFTTVTYSPFDGACLDPDSRDYPGRTKVTPTAVVDETFRLIDHNRGRASELKMPLLLVVARDDEVVDSQAAERYFTQAKGEPKRICLLDNSGHEVPVDYQWEDVAHEIGDFLRGLPGWGDR